MAKAIVEIYWWVIYQLQKGLDWIYSQVFHSIDIDLSEEEDDRFDD